MIATATETTLYDEIKAEFQCDHADAVLTRRTLANGRESLPVQCQRCGTTVRTMKRIETTAQQRREAPEFDPEIRKRFYAEYSERSSAAYRRQRERESAEWWARYNDYLRSPEWRQRRLKVFRRDRSTCQACLERRATQVHHRSYQHLGNEPLFDLVAVCDECHETIHQAPTP